MDPVITFHRVFPAAHWPLHADSSALGTMPAGPFQYCEAMRTASAFGWYVFPAIETRLKWTGGEVLRLVDGAWQPFVACHIDEEFVGYWDEYAPEDLKGWAPPYLINLFVPGCVTIWSGLLVSTAPGWSTLIRPLVNVPYNIGFQCFEGLVETDRFKPCLLFVNIRMIAVDREVIIQKDYPLFQAQPINRDCYSLETLRGFREYDGIRPRLDGIAGMSRADWEGFRKTIRRPGVSAHRAGSYGADVRRRAKR